LSAFNLWLVYREKKSFTGREVMRFSSTRQGIRTERGRRSITGGNHDAETVEGSLHEASRCPRPVFRT
jgi:hypothetical protein